MKKHITLSIVLATMVLNSTSIVHATAKQKQAASNVNETQANKKSMKDIEKEIAKVRQQFKKNGDSSIAIKQLKNLERRVAKLVAKMKKDEVHGKMWEIHQHTLERKIKEAREFVAA